MTTTKIIISIIFGLLCTITVYYLNEVNATILLTGIAYLCWYIMQKHIYYTLFVYTIGLCLFILLWIYLNLFEFNGYKRIPLWSPLVVFIVICCIYKNEN